MGKDNSGQRTKGNVKPSSSGRSAELLGGVAGFVGFSGLSDLGYVPAATQATLDDNAQISAEFRVTLRKMSKKDATTKIKALQEFESLCSTEDIESLKTAIPFWPRLFSKLSVDCDRRVREASQSAHSALVYQIGKNLAPYLRVIMPSWLLAMTDPHTPAAVNATKSFQLSFSEEKRPGVMIFCSKEIIDYIFDNIFVQSSQTLSDPKTTPKEDQDSKYLRVICGSLKSLSLFLENTSKLSDKKAEILAKIVPFLEHEKFWKMAKHENNLVRCAWFGVIKTFFEFDVEILRIHSEKLSKTIFQNMDTSEAAVLPHIWITFLHVCVGLPECWSFCDNPKSVFNRIFSVLRDGGRGHMCEMSPQLLPILSVIPVHVLQDQTAFHIDFFRAISTSLRKEKVLICKRDVSAIIVALNECLKYMSKEHGDNKLLWDTLMKHQVVDLVVSSFVDTPQLSETALYQEIAKLLMYWACATNSKGENYNRNKLKMFWEKFLPECETWISEGRNEVISKLTTFFTILRDPYSTVAKRSKGVRFSEELVPLSPTNQELNLTGVSTTQKDVYVSLLSDSLVPLIKRCFNSFKDNRFDSVYKLFATLLFYYSSEATYRQMVDQKVDDGGSCRVLFLTEYILPLMDISSIDSPVETTVSIFMHVYAHLPQENQKQLLMNLKPTLKVNALKVLIEKMTDRSETDSVSALWLKSPELGSRFLKCLQKLCTITLTKDALESHAIREQHSCLTELLSFILSNGYKDRTIFSLEYQTHMLIALKMKMLQLESDQHSLDNEHNQLSSNSQLDRQLLENQQTEHSADNQDTESMKFILLVTKLLNCLLNSSIHSQVDSLDEITKALYHMLCYPLKNTSEEVMLEVRTCFLRALEHNLLDCLSAGFEDTLRDENSLLVYVLAETKKRIMDGKFTFTKIIELCDLFDCILMTIFKSSPIEDCSILLDHSVIQPVFDILLPTAFEWGQLESTLSPLYVAPAILNGTFICREFPLPTSSREAPKWNQGYIKWSLFLTRLLETLCASSDASGMGPVASIDEESLSLGQFTPLLVLALHGACQSSLLVHMYTYLNNDSLTDDIKLGSEKLGECLRKLLSLVNIGNKRLIVKHLRDRCAVGDSSWCVTLSQALGTWVKVPVNATKLIEEINDSFLGYTQCKQIMLPHLPPEEALEILIEETTRLSELCEDPFSALPSVCLITSVFEHLAPVSRADNSNQVTRELVESAIHTVFTVLVKWRDAASNIFLFASDLNGVGWEDVSLLASIIRLLTVILKSHSIHLLHSHWDVALCALSAWVQSLVQVAQFPENSTVVAMFASACSKCAGVVCELLAELKDSSSLMEKHPPTLIEEWEEFFAPSVFNTLMLKFIQCSNVYQKERSVILYSLVRSLSLSVGRIEGSIVKELNLPPLFNAADDESAMKLPDNLQFILNHLLPLVLSRHPHCQNASFNILEAALKDVVVAWEMNPLIVNDEDDLPQRPLPRAIIGIVEEAGPVVETVLIDEEFGCMCEVLPYTDTYTYVSGYLLGWLLVLKAVTHGDESNQQLYTSYIRESDLLPSLLSSLFKLMPLDPALDKEAAKSSQTMFTTPVTISASGKVCSEFISWLSCQVYLSCLVQLPAAVRSWWTNLDRNTQQIVDRFTTVHVSPMLIGNEINTINNSNVKFNNMVIKCRPGAREIVAVYTIDEASMELVLRMSPNHPLSTVALEDHRRVGVSVAQWRNWLLGLNTMLSHRNTPLLNSLDFWKKNVDQKFEGIEECFICYYVLHGTNHQIPKLLCRTCKKKFHSACLYKWFSTSNNSTCPICRSLF